MGMVVVVEKGRWGIVATFLRCDTRRLPFILAPSPSPPSFSLFSCTLHVLSDIYTHTVHSQPTRPTTMAIIPRTLLNELRAAFRMLEEPLFAVGGPTATTTTTTGGSMFGLGPPSSSPLFNTTGSLLQTPNTRLHEEPDHYVVEAEMPGVKKDDLSVEFSEGGALLHISGTRGLTRAPAPNEPSSAASNSAIPPDASVEQQPAATHGDNGSGNPTAVTSSTAAAGSTVTPPTDWTSNARPGFSSSYGTFSNTFVSGWSCRLLDEQWRFLPCTVTDGQLPLAPPPPPQSTLRMPSPQLPPQRFPRPVDVSQVQAKYEDGVLRLTIPKLEKVEGRQSIEIQ